MSEAGDTNHLAKLIDVIGTSEVSIEAAIEGAIAHISRTVRNLQWFQVMETRGHIKDQKISHYQVVLRVAFGVEDEAGS